MIKCIFKYFTYILMEHKCNGVKPFFEAEQAECPSWHAESSDVKPAFDSQFVLAWHSNKVATCNGVLFCF